MNLGSCSQCRRSATLTELRKCSKCKNVRYCGPDCQRKHWYIHKNMCGITPLNLGKNIKKKVATAKKNDEIVYASDPTTQQQVESKLQLIRRLNIGGLHRNALMELKTVSPLVTHEINQSSRASFHYFYFRTTYQLSLTTSMEARKDQFVKEYKMHGKLACQKYECIFKAASGRPGKRQAAEDWRIMCDNVFQTTGNTYYEDLVNRITKSQDLSPLVRVTGPFQEAEEYITKLYRSHRMLSNEEFQEVHHLTDEVISKLESKNREDGKIVILNGLKLLTMNGSFLPNDDERVNMIKKLCEYSVLFDSVHVEFEARRTLMEYYKFSNNNDEYQLAKQSFLNVLGRMENIEHDPLVNLLANGESSFMQMIQRTFQEQ